MDQIGVIVQPSAAREIPIRCTQSRRNGEQNKRGQTMKFDSAFRFRILSAAMLLLVACAGQPTTVLDLTGDEPLLVRRGRGDPALLGLQLSD